MRGCLGDLHLYVAQDFQHRRPLIEKREHCVDGVLLLVAELIKIARTSGPGSRNTLHDP